MRLDEVSLLVLKYQKATGREKEACFELIYKKTLLFIYGVICEKAKKNNLLLTKGEVEEMHHNCVIGMHKAMNRYNGSVAFLSYAVYPIANGFWEFIDAKSTVKPYREVEFIAEEDGSLNCGFDDRGFLDRKKMKRRQVMIRPKMQSLHTPVRPSRKHRLSKIDTIQDESPFSVEFDLMSKIKGWATEWEVRSIEIDQWCAENGYKRKDFLNGARQTKYNAYKKVRGKLERKSVRRRKPVISKLAASVLKGYIKE